MEYYDDTRQIDVMYNLCQLKKISDTNYIAVLPSFMFPDIFDYSRGFLHLEISMYPVQKTDDYHISCSIVSIDDSGATIHIQDDKLGKQMIKLKRLVQYFEKSLKQMSFGNLAEMQKDLQELGFYYASW